MTQAKNVWRKKVTAYFKMMMTGWDGRKQKKIRIIANIF
jgi:hypothetical protein